MGGFFFDFEAVRTASSDRDAPRRHPEEHVTGGEVTQGECARLAKHLSESFGTIGLVPEACRGVLGRGP